MAGASMEKIIKAAVDRGATDLHIRAGDVFKARVNGRLVPLTKQRLTPEQTRAIASRLMPSERDRGRLEALRDFDCSWGMSGVGRFRVNILRQRSSYMIVMRVLPFTLPTLADLNLPEVVGTITEAPNGLILVTGVSGSGKSATVGAMIHHINQHQARHIVTIEDPIEVLHRDLSSTITQREVGVDTDSATIGLQAALRQDPNVIFASDLSDPAAMDTAIRAAEAGHLVIAAMPTPDVAATIRQVLATLPREELEIGRVRFSESLRAIVSLQLLPTADGAGRVPAVEVLVATDEIREALKEGADQEPIRKLMQKGGPSGMTTFAKSVKELVSAGRISAETAKAVTRESRGN